MIQDLHVSIKHKTMIEQVEMKVCVVVQEFTSGITIPKHRCKYCKGY